METASTLTSHKFNILKQDEGKLQTLNKQSKEMKYLFINGRSEYSNMTKKREENIRELENKFQKAIQEYLDNKQFIIDEYNEIN